MGIRGKLLLLLIAVAVLPLALAIVYVRISDRGLGETLTDQTQEQLIAKAHVQFRQMQALAVEAIRRDRERMELALRVQARQMQDAWTSPPPIPLEWTTTDDMDDMDDADASVDRDQVAVRLPRGANPDSGAIRHSIGRHHQALDAYRFVRTLCPDLIARQYTSFTNGVFGVYPAQGGYGARFDPRSRQWFRAQMSSREPLWHQPMIDEATGEVHAVHSAPLFDEDGAIIGATAIDIPLHRILHDLDLPDEWAESAQVMITALLEDADGLRQLKVVTSQDHVYGPSDSTGRVTLRTLHSSTTQTFAAMLDDMAAFGSGVRRMHFHDQPALWAYGPLDIQGESADLDRDGVRRIAVPLLLIVNEEDILRDARRTEEMFDERLEQQLQFTGVLLGSMLAVIGVLTIVLSRRLTDPVKMIHDAAQRVSDGDMSARADVHSDDELGELAAAFNDMVPQLEDRLHMQQALAFAREVQQQLLPHAPPALAEYDIAAIGRSCDETGGDYYDYFVHSDADDRPMVLTIAVGDVTGHGVGAALLMATARAMLRMTDPEASELAPMVTRLNRRLHADTPDGRFMTMFMLRVDLSSHRLSWVSAGHLPGMRYAIGSNQFVELGGRDIPLGIESDWTYSSHESDDALAPGELVLLGTDGVTETRRGDGAMFGIERLEQVVRLNEGRDARSIAEAIVAAVDTFRGSAPLADDLTLVIIRRRGEQG